MEPEWTAERSEPVSAAAAATFLRGFLQAPSGATAAAEAAAAADAAAADGASGGGRGARETRASGASSADGGAHRYTPADTARLLRELEKDAQRQDSTR